ncbi:TonB-dependent receptor domain-containing protein [Brevundimonas sp.]|uniref:TonB-dependent receptor domain-containing protein n=2 Tax=unclassified Brevundimonas TaxID=2622653 RepID=UPI002898DB79|nr:TonB-dependent receptor [Brevundimonas sp.]
MITMRNALLSSTMIVGCAAMALPAYAQSGSSSQSDEVTQVQEVVVTGSRIRRDPATAPTPLIQISKEELIETGQSSVIEYLATIPALMNSQVPSDTTAGVLNAGGLSLPNLRSLGSGRTLSLVNGRRHVGSAAGSLSVDSDVIPRLLVRNIEIVTGGASSVYGADAVSGVLNYVLRDDFEGIEIDARAAQINQDGQMQYRIAGLVGRNFFDDRLNLYGYAEYEKGERLDAEDIDWLRDGWSFTGNDADPTAAPADGVWDAVLYRDVRTLQLLKWGQVTLAGNYIPSPTSNPNIVPTAQCTTGITQSMCFGVDPTRTWVFDGLNARLANFGTWVQQTGTNRVTNVGGDGLNPNTTFNVDAVYPESERQLYQVGMNFKVNDYINIHAEAKYQDETTDLATGYAFADVYIANVGSATDSAQILSARTSGPSAFLTRLDNAFLPANLRTAIQNNVQPVYCLTVAGCAGGVPYGGVTNPAQAMPFARYSAWTLTRPQLNEKQLQRYVISADGELAELGFIKNLNWDIGYTYGRVDNRNYERSVDGERFSYALDSVVDTLGVLGTPGKIVCRVQLGTANGGLVTNRNPFNPLTGQGVGPARIGADDPDIQQCVPLNIFGEGNQSQEALDYVRSEIIVDQMNEQHDVMGVVSGQLWDMWGAGPIGFALGGEWRKEVTEGTGRDKTTAGRWLLSNTGPDFLRRDYSVKEGFAEISIPLFRESVLGDYAEFTASYRYSDFSQFGASDVYGVNLVYRPIPDIAVKTSFNTSVRAPSLGENYSPATQTFAQPTDVCDSRQLNALQDQELKTRRLANCELLAQSIGFAPNTFNFADQFATNAYRPEYPSSVAGFNQGNPDLQPEESESFTFSVVLQPRFIPDFQLVLDYYEIAIDNVIASVAVGTNVALCVSGPVNTLVAQNCDRVTRSLVNDPATPRDDRMVITSFVQDSLNYARREVRGLDFTTRYRWDLSDFMGRDMGRLEHSLNGSWLIEQKNFNNIDNPADFTSSEGNVYYPRVRMSSNLSWRPNEKFSVTWTADWQSAQDLNRRVATVTNWDNREPRYQRLENFMRNDLTVRYKVRDDLTLRAGVVNMFDAEPPVWVGGNIYSNLDPFGRRFSIGLNYQR